MKIRCQSCYRVLNYDEEYCTRCGTHSEEVTKILATGEIPPDEGAILKIDLIFYLIFGFALNGILYVIFGKLFETFYPGETAFGEIGTEIPNGIRFFSISNALFASSIVIFFFILFFHFSDFKNNFLVCNIKRLVYSLIALIPIAFAFSFLAKETSFSIIPNYYKEFLLSPTKDMEYVGSINLLKVIVPLVFYGITQEFIFRKSLINALDEGTLLGNKAIIIFQALISVILEGICFSFFARYTGFELLYSLITSFIFHIILGISYFYNYRSLTINVIFRVVLIIISITIMYVI